MQLPEIDLLTQPIDSILWPPQSMCHFVHCSSERFTISICWHFLSYTDPHRLMQQLHSCAFGIYGTMCMTKDLLFGFQLPSFVFNPHQINMNTGLVGDFLGDTQIYTSRGVNLCYCCLLQKYKELFKKKQFGAVLHLPLLTVHPSNCPIILQRGGYWSPIAWQAMSWEITPSIVCLCFWWLIHSQQF